MKLIYFTLLLVIATPGWSDVVLLGDRTQKLSYQKYLQSSQNSDMSWVEHSLSLQISMNEKQDLLHKFEQGILHFYAKDYKSAKQVFTGLLDYRSKLYLPPLYKKALLESYFYLAEIESMQSKKHYWLETAFYYSPQHKLSLKKWSPTLVSLWDNLKKQSNPTYLTLEKYTKDFDRIIALQSSYSLKEKLSFQINHSIEVLLLSNTFKPVKLRFDSQGALLSSAPKTQAFVQGNCSGFQPNSAALNGVKNLEVYFTSKCIFPMKAKTPATAADHSMTDTNLAAPSNPAFKASLDLPDTTSSDTIAQPKKSIFKSPWFWLGLGAVAIFIENQNQNEKKTSTGGPTEVYGF